MSTGWKVVLVILLVYVVFESVFIVIFLQAGRPVGGFIANAVFRTFILAALCSITYLAGKGISRLVKGRRKSNSNIEGVE